MSEYKIKLINQNRAKDEIVIVSDQQNILEAIEDQGISVPKSCKTGTCSTCVGKLHSGSVDQSDQGFLDEDQLNEGYILMCVAYPKSDCVIKTHVEDDLY